MTDKKGVESKSKRPVDSFSKETAKLRYENLHNMEVIKEKIKLSKSEEEKDRLNKELAEISQQFNFYMEYNRQLNK